MAFNAYMHERNIYKKQPDFTQIALDFPEIRKYAILDAKGQKVRRIDFTNTDALRMLTKILLKKDFNLDVEIPEGFLIPTVPQRLNYILWVEDLLLKMSRKREYVSGVDIGTGACAIFSLLGARKNGWKFIATESSDDAISWAEKNISKNNLAESIKVIKVNESSTLNEVLSANNEIYEFCLCNPPFFESIEEIRNKHRNSDETIADVAQKEEIFVKGGELDFVRNILKDSLIYKARISLFTSMFGKKKSFLQIVKEIQEIKDAKFTTTEFCQGNTVRWGVAWTFDESVHFEEKVKKRKKAKKTKPPLEYQILIKSENAIFDDVVERTKQFIKSLQIPITVTRLSKNFAEFSLKSAKNTWSHQRRKRRELERQKKDTSDLDEKHNCDSVSEVDKTSVEGSNENTSLSIISNEFPKSDAIELKETELENTNTACIKSEPPVKQCNLDSEPIISETIQSNVSVSLTSESEIIRLQNNKRNNDFISEDLCKRARLDKEISNEYIREGLITTSENDQLDVKDGHVAENSENFSASIKVELEAEIEKKTSEKCLVLDCLLQFIKGKKKIFVKMNCPLTADRNTMHQVFQLIKNKIN